jgi:hypothetical protein
VPSAPETIARTAARRWRSHAHIATRIDPTPMADIEAPTFITHIALSVYSPEFGL